MYLFNIEKLNVQDEIPSGAIRFDIKKNDGTILYSNVDITMITSILQKGTELNKALHDKIDYMAECVASLDNVGNDIEKFILTGEFAGYKLFQIETEEYEKVQLNTKLSQLSSNINSLGNRVTALENSTT